MEYVYRIMSTRVCFKYSIVCEVNIQSNLLLEHACGVAKQQQANDTNDNSSDGSVLVVFLPFPSPFHPSISAVTSRSAAATGAAGAPPAPANAPSTPPSPAPSPAAAAAARAAMQFEFGRASSAGINGPLAVNGRPAVPSTFPPASSTTSSASVNGKNGHSNGHGVNGGRPSYISPPSSTTSNGNVAIHGKPAGLATSTSTVAAAAVAAATAVVTAVKASAAAAAAISSASSVLSSPLTPPSTHPPSSNASSHPQSPSTLDADADTAPLARLFSVSPAAGPVTDTQLMANDDPQVHLAAVHAALGTPRAIRQYTAALDAFLRGQCSSAYFSRFALQLFASRAESLSGGSSGDLGPDEAFVTAATAVTSQVVVPLRTRAAAPGAAAHNALVLSLLRATLHSHHAAASQAAVDCASAARAAAAAQQAARAAERAAQSPLAHPLPLPRKRRRLATEPQEDRRVRLRREAMALPVEDRDRIRRAFYAQFPDEAEAAAAAAGDLDQSVAAASAVISAAADANASVAPKRKRRKEKKVSAVGAANAGGDLAEAGSVDIDPLSGYVPPDRTGVTAFHLISTPTCTMEGDLPSLSTLGSRMACIAHESGVTTLSDSSVLYMMHAMQTFLKNVLDPSLRLNSLAEETPSSSVMDLSSPPVVNAAIGAAAPAKDLLGGSSTTRELTLGPLANVITLQPSLVADSRGVVDRVLAYQWHKTEEELEVSRVLGNWSALLPPPSPLLGDDGEILDAPPSEDVTSAVVVGADLGASPAAVLESPRAAVTTAVTTTTPNEE